MKFGAICAPALASMLWNEFYADDKAMILDLCDIMNAELRELADAGCPLIQVEEPPHHGRSLRPDCTEADLEFLTEAFNRQLVGVDAEIWVHTCWGNPNQQRVYWEVPSYEKAMPHLLQLNADVITFECASSDGRDLALFGKYKTDKKIGIGVVNHCNTVVEPPEYVAGLIRRALEFIPPERLVITTDCGFGREGLSRRIAYYKCVSMVEGTNIVRRELGSPEARVRAADPKLYFAGGVQLEPNGNYDEGSDDNGTTSADHQQGTGRHRASRDRRRHHWQPRCRCMAHSACSCTAPKWPAGWRTSGHLSASRARWTCGSACSPPWRWRASSRPNMSGVHRPEAHVVRTFPEPTIDRDPRKRFDGCRPTIAAIIDFTRVFVA